MTSAVFDVALTII